MFDVYKIREDFPILDRKVNNTDLVYFDNAATSQTPIQVIDAISAEIADQLRRNFIIEPIHRRYKSNPKPEQQK